MKLTNSETEEPKENESENSEKLPENKRTYKLNKSKVRKKCHAFSRLEKSKKFLAFYTITFPQNLPDENAYKVFNTWLTRCRKNCALKSYLWVAERQKNGTIHFHLLTNDFMKIQDVNGYMASCLATEKKRGLEVLNSIDTEIYQGVDVSKVGKSKKGIIGYLSKYISKNDIQFYRLPWHCSRDVSRLFTSINYEEDEEDAYYNQLPEHRDNYQLIYEDYYTVGGFKFTPNDEIYKDLDSANEAIYSSNN